MSDWEVDKAADAGFYCLRFSMVTPQYYQYRYESTASSLTASARGDLNDNGKFAHFSLRGEVRDKSLRLAPSIDETDPEE